MLYVDEKECVHVRAQTAEGNYFFCIMCYFSRIVNYIFFLHMQVFCCYLLLAVSTFSLHSFHQLHQPVYKCLLGGQQRPHHSHTLIALQGTGSVGISRGRGTTAVRFVAELIETVLV